MEKRSTSGNRSSRRNGADSRNRRPARRSGLKSFFTDQRTRLGFGILLVVIAVVMAVCAVSHLKNGALDYNLVSHGASVGEIADSGAQVHNAGGAFGAWLSHVLLTEGLGVGAFVLVIYLGIVGLSLLGVVKCRFWNLTFKCLYTAIAVSIIAGLVTLGSPSFFHWGGVHGRYANIWLEHVGSPLLSWAVSAVLLGGLVAVYLNPLKKLFRRIADAVPRRSAQSADAEGEAEEPIALDEVTDSADSPADNADDTDPDSRDVSFEDDVDNGEDRSFTPASHKLFDIDSDENSETSLEEFTDDAAPKSPAVPVAPTGPAAVSSNPAEPTFTIKETEALDSGASGKTAPGKDAAAALAALPYDPKAELSRYVFPSLDLLVDRHVGSAIDPEEQQRNKDLIVKTLLDYKIAIQSIEATIGPTVTLYEIVPAEGVRIAQIQRLENDIALSIAAIGIRIAPIPGAGTLGIEVPNRNPKIVSIRSILGSAKFAEACRKMILPMAMGATISNDVFIQDLAKMPHLLVAGATGQGKSVGLNCIIASLLYAKHPSELKFVFIDPKMVEFAAYRKLERHYLAKLPDADEAIITDPNKVPATLNSLCIEMDNRYKLMSMADVRNAEEYNRKFCNHALNPENGHRFMPYIVTIVDEFADLIMIGGKEVPFNIARIAQKGRAAGMHIIIATQRPSTDVISGMIKNNFTGRIAFRVTSMVDSKTILDRPGANQLIGKGDMLFLNSGKIDRVQCAFIDTPEIDAITDHINSQIGFDHAYMLPEPEIEGTVAADSCDPSKRDALFNDCARFIVTQSTASTSSLQRRFSIGYNKAGKIMDQMEAAGIVGAPQGAKPRAVLMDAATLETIL